MSELKQRASAARGGQSTGNGARSADTGQAEPVIDFDYGDDPEAVPVRVAWARVMRICRALTKGSTAEVKKDGKLLFSYKYRGIDDVVSLAGMAFRQVGVMVLPIEIKTEYRLAGQAEFCYVEITYEVTSLGEGSFTFKGKGQAVEYAGDKGTIKAEQQAYRMALIQALALPTYDPRMDSDATPVVVPEPPTPMEIRDEILDTGTSLQRLRAIAGELGRDQDLARAKVPVGDGEETLWDLAVRIGKARAEKPAEGGA